MLSDRQIKKAIAEKIIQVTPFFDSIGSNSIDLHLNPLLIRYQDQVLDMKKVHTSEEILIPNEGYVLVPGELYLGSTLERTASGPYVPLLEGKSSIGRLGISVHITAGVGDIGFEGHWTLEISVIKPVKVYPGVPIAQLMHFEAGGCDIPYYKKPSSKYNNQVNKPVVSAMHKNFPLKDSIQEYLITIKQ